MKKINIPFKSMQIRVACLVLSLVMLGFYFGGCKRTGDAGPKSEPVQSTVNKFIAHSPSPTNLPKKVLQLNLCGNSCWIATDPDGTGADTRGSVTRMAKVLDAIDNYDPDIVTFNEICYSQYRKIRPDMIARGYSSTYATTTTGGACDNFDKAWGRNFGDAVFSKGPVPNTQQRYLLPDSTGGEPRQLLCADTKLQGVDCKVCTTHLSNDSMVRKKQVRTIAQKANVWVNSTAVIITGDFNAIPSSSEMGLMYSHSGGTGVFQEADESDTCIPYCRGGEITFRDNKKIDYIFFSAQHFGGLTADAKSRYPNPITDHNCLEGSAVWQ